MVAKFKQEHRQSPLVLELQILETVNDIVGVARAPDYDQKICLSLDVPTEQPAPSAA
jgi:hypothetical protein